MSETMGGQKMVWIHTRNSWHKSQNAKALPICVHTVFPDAITSYNKWGRAFTTCNDERNFLFKKYNLMVNRKIFWVFKRYISTAVLLKMNRLYVPTMMLHFICLILNKKYMMTSSNENIFRSTGHLCGVFTRDRWIPLTKARDTKFWCFLWSAPE